MAFPKKWCVDEVLLEIAIGVVRLPEISLGVIVETCQRTNILYEVDDHTVDAQCEHDACQEDEKVVSEQGVVQGSGCQLRWSLPMSLGGSHGSQREQR